MKHAFKDRRTLFLVIVASLGYFVDIYDLVLFNVVKKESLEAIGLSGETLARYDTSLFNWQLAFDAVRFWGKKKTFASDQMWRPWQSTLGADPADGRVTCRNGTWIVEDGGFPLDDFRAPACSEIPQ